MTEISKDASVLIGISWQALKRAEKGDERTKISDCTVAIVFASFFIEANLNQIVEVLGKRQEMMSFLNIKRPGLQDKLAWFYNEYLAKPKLNSRNEGLKQLYTELKVKFPGFDEIYEFRNKISHGKIDLTTANLADAEILRVQAKSIVNELFKIAEQATGQVIPRAITYDDAIS
jgi:hypothetical protein